MQNDKAKFKREFISRLVRYSISILKFGEKLKAEKFFYSVIDQLVRCVTSIGANVVEAKASSSKRDYLKFFEIALKSANEAKYWLILIKEVKPKLAVEINILIEELDEISKILGASVLTLKGKR